MEFQAAFVVAVGHDGVTDLDGEFTLVNDTVCAEVIRCACLDKFLAVDKEVNVAERAAFNGEGTDSDGVRRDIGAVERDILHHDQVVVMRVVAEAESPCVVMVDSRDGEILAVQRGVHLEFAALDVVCPVINFVGGEVKAQFVVAGAGGGVDIVRISVSICIRVDVDDRMLGRDRGDSAVDRDRIGVGVDVIVRQPVAENVMVGVRIGVDGVDGERFGVVDMERAFDEAVVHIGVRVNVRIRIGVHGRNDGDGVVNGRQITFDKCFCLGVDIRRVGVIRICRVIVVLGFRSDEKRDIQVVVVFIFIIVSVIARILRGIRGGYDVRGCCGLKEHAVFETEEFHIFNIHIVSYPPDL